MNAWDWRKIRNISTLGTLLLVGACEGPLPDPDPLVVVDDDADARVRKSNFQVEMDGVWRGLSCLSGDAGIGRGSTWTEYDRTLTDETAGLKLMCPEGGPSSCWCDYTGERMHGINGWELDASLKAEGGGPVYPNELMETCLYIRDDGEIITDWTGPDCPNFRLL